MPRKADLTEVGTKTFTAIGLQAGGYSCRQDLTIGANPGFQIISTDEGTIACYRNPGDVEWKQLFRYGDNLPASEAVYKGYAEHAYLVARSSSDPQVMVASMYGKIYRTTVGAEGINAWTLLTAYKGGAIDTTLHHQPHFDARLRGPTCQIDPVNSSLFMFGNPIDGAYMSADGGTTIALVSTGQIPAPINVGNERYGVNFAFDYSTASGGKTQTVYCSSAGNAIRRSTTGADSGVWTDIGGPLHARDMFAAGGLLWVCDKNQSVWKWNGTTWTQMLESGNPVQGSTVAVRPSNALHVAVIRDGGSISHTTDGGTTWTFRDDAFSVGSGGPAWFTAIGAIYLAPGMMRWDETGATNRWCLTMGLGYCEFDAAPRTSLANKWRGDSLGILELIPTLMHFTEKGNLLIAAHDRALWGFASDKLADVPAGVGPNYITPITHGTDVESIYGDPDFVIAARYMEVSNTNYWKHLGGGIDPNGWVQINAPAADIGGGNLIALTRTNYILQSAGAFGPKYTTDGGATWLDPVFRLTAGGTIVSMTGVGFGTNLLYAARRKILCVIEGVAGGALMFVAGNEAAGDARTGIWKTVDGGANWLKVYDGHMNGINLDYFSVKMRPVRGYPNAWFWTAGAVAGPVVGGLNTAAGPAARFSNDQFVTNALIPGFDEVFDIAVGPSDTNAAGARSHAFGWVYVWGWRSGELRVWISKNFDPTNLATATWTADVQYPGGRTDVDGVLAANPKRPGQYVIGTPAGGAYLRQFQFDAKAA